MGPTSIQSPIMTPTDLIIHDALEIASSVAKAIFITCPQKLWEQGPARVFSKACSIPNYYPLVRLIDAILNLIDVAELAEAAKSFKMIKDLLITAMIIDGSRAFINNIIDKEKWYKMLSSSLRFVGSVFKFLSFTEKYGEVVIPIYTWVRKSLLNSSFIKSLNSPMINNFIINPDALAILIDAVCNMGITAFFYISGNDAERKRQLDPKSVLDFLCNLGKAILICTGAGYGALLIVRIISVATSALAELKVLALS